LHGNELKRPKNIIPLSFFQSALQGYTDKDIKDIPLKIDDMKVYKHFAQLFDKL